MHSWDSTSRVILAALLFAIVSCTAQPLPEAADNVCVAGVLTNTMQQQLAARSALRITHIVRQLLSDADLMPRPREEANAASGAITYTANGSSIATVTPAKEAQTRALMQRSDVRFVENKGQIADTEGRVRNDILFTADAHGARLYFRKDGVSYVFLKTNQATTAGAWNADTPLMRLDDLPGDQSQNQGIPSTVTTYRMDMQFVGARPDVRVHADGELEGVNNFYYGHCPDGVLGVRSYARIVYENVYDHIDLEYLSSGGRVKYNFIVKPGGDVHDILLHYNGASKMHIDREGALHIETPMGSIEEAAPVSYQHAGSAADARTDAVQSAYVLHGTNLSFDVQVYDHTRDLVIDPWATYYGGSSDDYARSVARDASGNVVIAGATVSTNFPTQNAFQSTYGGGYTDAYVVKLNASGARLWATYYSGNGSDVAYAVATDGSGNVVIAGLTHSTNFPTLNAFQPTGGGPYTSGGTYNDAFIVKLDANGSRLWATYYGGSDPDVAYGVATDGSGNVVITGYTQSTNFPTLNAIQSTKSTAEDAFIVKLNASGARLWATYYGGNGTDIAHGVAIDGSGNVVFAGSTESTNFPTLSAFQATLAGGSDAFVVKLSASGVRLWATYYGGNAADDANGVATDGSGNVVIAGATVSTNFPTQSAFQSTFGGVYDDAFVVKLTASGSRMWATYYGSSNADEAYGVATDGSGNVVIVGYTKSTYFPTYNALQPTFGGGTYDAFVVKLDAIGARLWATFYGGNADDYGYGVTTDGSGNVVFAGYTQSTNFRILNALQTTCAGMKDAFIASMTANGTMGCTTNPTPALNGANSVCAGSTGVVYTTDAGMSNYVWTVSPGGTITAGGTSTSSTAIATWSTVGVQSVSVNYTNANGCSGISPTQLNVTVDSVPTVNSVSNQVVCHGNPTALVPFSGAVSGTTYSWANSNPAIGLAASGTGAIASFTATNPGTAPISGTVTVTPHTAMCTGTPATFTITVNPMPTVNAIANVVACSGGTVASVAFSGTVPGTVYSWSNNTTSIGLVSSGSGNIPSFTATNAGPVPVTATITVTPSYTNAGVTCTGTAKTFTITINPIPTVDTVANVVACSGNTVASVAFSSTVPGTVYSWTNSTTSISLAASGTGNLPAFTAANTGTAPVTATITVTPSYTNAGVTCTGTSKIFTITVNPATMVNAVASQVLCTGAASTAVAFGGGIAGTVYTWTNSNSAIGLAASGSGDIASFIAANVGSAPLTATITVTPSFTDAGVTCTGTAKTFTITVNPSPTVSTVKDVAVCTGSTVASIPFSGSVSGTVFTWTSTAHGTGLGASGTAGTPSFTGVNRGTVPLIDTVTVTPSYTNAGVTCIGAARTFTVTVNPTPTVDPLLSQVVCNGSATTAISFTGAMSGTVYTWTNSNPTIGLATGGTGPIAAFTAKNTGTSPVAATITVTPTYFNSGTTCTGTPAIFTITVNPTPSVDAVENQSYCTGRVTAPLAFTGPMAATEFTWVNSNPGIGLPASGTGHLPSFTAVNTGGASVTATITVTPSVVAAGVMCTGPVRTFTITVMPPQTTTVTPVTPLTVCQGDDAILEAAAGIGYSYQWFLAGNPLPGETGQRLVTQQAGTYAVVITTGTGCTLQSTPVTVTVLPQPVAVITPLGPTALCPGDSVILDAGAGFASYAWSTGASTRTIVVRVTGDYTVTVRTAQGCIAMSTPLGVRVNAALKPVIAVHGRQQICRGDSTLLEADLGYKTYTWSTGATTRSIVVRDSGDYTVQVSTFSGCAGTSDPVHITVSPPAEAPTAQDVLRCDSGPVTLMARSVQPGVLFRWYAAYTGGQRLAENSGSYITQVLPATTDYYVAAVNAAGCESPRIRVRAVIHPSPVPLITPVGALVIAAGDSVVLHAPPGYRRYVWSGGATTASIVVRQAGSYTVTVTDSAGCSGTSAPVTVTQKTATPGRPTITASGPLAFCDGSTVTLTASQGSAYDWKQNGASVASTRAYQAGTAGSYWCLVKDSAGAWRATDTVTITVHPLPAPTLFVRRDTLYCTIGTAWQWYLGGAPIMGATAQTWIAQASGIYSVRATDLRGCTGRSPDVVVTLTGVYAPAVPMHAFIGPNFPNPFHYGTSIPVTMTEPGVLVLDICDLSGGVVRRLLATHVAAGPHTFTWDGRDMHGMFVATGQYLVRAKHAGALLQRVITVLR